MPDYPCVADTDSIELVVTDALRANLRLDDDLTNGLVVNGDGLGAPYGVMDAGRAFRSTSQNVTNGDTMGISNVRFDTTNGKIYTGGSGLSTSRAGLWLMGASIAFNTGAAVGTALAYISTTFVGTVAVDSGGSPAAFAAGTAETIALNPVGIAYLPAGAAISVVINHNFGGTIPTVPSSSFPPGTVGAGIEMGGQEIWAILLKGA